MKPGGTTHLDVLGGSFSLSTDDDDWHAFLQQLWRPFVAASSGAPSTQIAIEKGSGGWTLRVAGTEDRSFEDPWRAANEIRHSIANRALDAAEGVLDLHAAALVFGDRGLLLAGRSGAGKTTLAIALAERGWEVFSDDVALISESTLEMIPFPKPLALRNRGAWERLARRWEPPPWPVATRGEILLPASAVGLPTRQRAAPSAIVFLDRIDGEGASLETISSASAIVRAGELVRAMDRSRLVTLERIFQITGGAATLTYGAGSTATQILDRDYRPLVG